VRISSWKVGRGGRRLDFPRGGDSSRFCLQLVYLNWRRLGNEVVAGSGVALAVTIFAPWVGLWLVGKPHFLLFRR
jgi:hypothetical protein